jgi:hypothetical protein
MIARLRRAHGYFKAHGAGPTAGKIVHDTLHYVRNTPQRLRYQAFQRRLKGRDPQEVFVEIYERNLWESAESRSGIGSEAIATENIRRHLPVILERFSIRSILDAPCGDFNWMRLVALPAGVSYVGWDIVPQVIDANRGKYADAQHEFAVSNMLSDPFPRVDLMMCRDCLFHFSHADIRRTLQNFVAADIPFLFTTTHSGRDESTNTDIETGYFRRIDLFCAPFSFPADPLYRVEDFAPGHLAREMCLWDRSQVQTALASLTRYLADARSHESA